MQEIIISIMDQWGYVGVAFLIALENLFPPIPSEVILTFGGFMTTHAEIQVVGMILVATVGSVLGALFLYFIGSFVSEERLEKLVSGKLGKVLRLKKTDIQKAEKWFNNRGIFTVFFCRFIPIVRSLISIPAGIARMKLVPFLLLTTMGSLIWNTVLILLGRVAGDNWESIVHYASMYSKIGLVVLCVLGIGFAIRYYEVKIKKKRGKNV